MRKLLPWAVMIGWLALPAFGADPVVEEIVARINNRIVTLTEYQRSTDDLKQEAQQQDASERRQTVCRTPQGRPARPH